MPTKPVSALGNQYVTFNPESPEIFKMKQRVWSSHQPFDVKDVTNNDWFKIEGKDAQVHTAMCPVVIATRLSSLHFGGGGSSLLSRRHEHDTRHAALGRAAYALTHWLAVDRAEKIGAQHGGASLLR